MSTPALKNISRQLIEARIEEQLKKTDICGCPRCRADILAHALTHVAPKYAATDETAEIMRYQLSASCNTEINDAVNAAMTVVKKKPRH